MTTPPSGPGAATAVRRVAGMQLRGRAGPLPARAYWPGSPTAGPGGRPPLVLLFPADGRVPAGLDAADHLARRLCATGGAVVLAVTYRTPPDGSLAPAVEDAATATGWAGDHAAELGADPGCLAVAGEGLGTALAVAVGRRARREGWPPIRRQLWIPPGLEASGVDRLARSLRRSFEPAPAPAGSGSASAEACS